MSCLLRVDSTQFRRQAWRNGRGHTLELASGPDRDDWRWRISLAQDDEEGDFSEYPGTRRQLTPLDGGLRLLLADGTSLDAQRLQTLSVAGSPAPACRLPEGPTRVFNLMLRGNQQGRLLVRPLLGSMVLLPVADTLWFVYVVAGHAGVHCADEQLSLGMDDAVLVHATYAQRVIVEGGGEIALVRLDGATPPTN